MKYGIDKPHLFYKNGLWRVVQLGHLTSFGETIKYALDSFKHYNAAIKNYNATNTNRYKPISNLYD
jgi:hypothetical protein